MAIAQIADPDSVQRLESLLIELDSTFGAKEYLVQGVSKKEAVFLNRNEVLSRLNLQDARDIEHSERLSASFDDAIVASQLPLNDALTQTEASLRYFRGMGIDDFTRLLNAGDRGLHLLAEEVDEDQSLA